ncbi:MAG: 4'-phosphopantetheinyl transferase [Sandaracinaceae bacterium]
MDASSRRFVRCLFRMPVRVREMDPRSADPAVLHPEEHAVVAKAVEKRKREFAAGRLMARSLLSELGVPPDFRLLPAPHRGPAWPMEVVGSISHTERWAAVAVASARSGVRSVGCDVEGAEDLREELWRSVCTPEEHRWLHHQPAERRGRLAKVMFSAKECFYKLQYPLTETFLGFHAVDVEPRDNGTFTVRLRREAGALEVGRAFEGAYAIEDGLVATGMTLARE